MKHLLVIFITFIILTTSYLLFATNSYAQYGQYGGPGPSLSIMINKTVGKPIVTKGGTANVDYVDNLSPFDPRLAPGQDVWFKLQVKNTSNVNLKNVVVKDTLPNYIDPIEGPGTFDANTRIITINVGNLAMNQSIDYYLKTRVQPLNQLPADKGLFCVVNRSRAETNQVDSSSLSPTISPNQNNIAAEDTAQLCIEKQVTQITPGVSQVPLAGPELGIILIAGELLALGTGLFLKRKLSK